MSSSLSSSALRLLSSKPPINPRNALLARTPPFIFFFSSPISFHRLTKTSHHQPIKAHQQQQQQPPSAAAPTPEAEFDPSLLPAALRDIIVLFQSVPDHKAKYHQLLHYGRQLPPLDPRYKTDEHRVRGCVSQVWVRALPDPENPAAVRFEADSDSALTKGLAALLVLGLSGSPAPVIACVPPDFVHLLGLHQSLTPSRNNGFLNMLRLMQQKALQLHAHGGDQATTDGVSKLEGSSFGIKEGILEGKVTNLDETANGFRGNSVNREASGANGHGGMITNDVLEVEDVISDHDGDGIGGGSVISGDLKKVEGDDTDEVDSVSSSSGGGLIGRAERIRERLERELSPVELEVEDISNLHAGHAGVRGSNGGETHFNVRVVSKEFEGKSLVKRHRLVYGLLQEELQSGLHALSIDAKTPSEVRPS